MSEHTKALARAIRQSIHTSSSAAVTLTDAEFDDLLCESEDSARENDGTHDVWGTDDNGNQWRLRVTIAD